MHRSSISQVPSRRQPQSRCELRAIPSFYASHGATHSWWRTASARPRGRHEKNTTFTAPLAVVATRQLRGAARRHHFATKQPKKTRARGAGGWVGGSAGLWPGRAEVGTRPSRTRGGVREIERGAVLVSRHGITVIAVYPARHALELIGMWWPGDTSAHATAGPARKVV